MAGSGMDTRQIIEIKEAQRRAAEELNPWSGVGPEPTAPELRQLYDAGSMSISPGLQSRLENINLDKRALEALRGEGLRRGPSAWGRLAEQKQRAEEMLAAQQAQAQARAEGLSAQQRLAMRGGLQSGARERIARGTAQNVLQAQQGIAGQGRGERFGLAMQDESQRLQTLRALPGMEVQSLQPELQKAELWGQARKADIANELAAKQAEQNARLEQYKQQMAGYGAKQTARAIEKIW